MLDFDRNPTLRALALTLTSAAFSFFAVEHASARFQPEPDPPVIKPGERSKSVPKGVAAPSAAPTTEWTQHKSADGSHPDGNEQRMMWLMNRARTDSTAEGIWLAESTHPDVKGGRDDFGVNTTELKNAFAAISAKPPAAFDVQLYNASRDHSLDLISRDAQDHNGQIDKINASGFNCSGTRASVFSYSDSALNAHAALNIDWGNGPNGMQDPPGHRYAIMDVDAAPLNGVKLANAGLALVAESDPNTSVGPLVFSGAYCQGGSGEFNRFIVGTVWSDANANQEYDSGEGINGVTVTPDSGAYYAVTGSAGGYAVPITAAGTYTVTFSSGGFSSNVSRSVSINDDSVLVDLLDRDGDGQPDDVDNCPNTANANQANADGDSAGDLCDDFDNDANETTDSDGDGMGDNFENTHNLNLNANDASQDPDNDNLDNLSEFQNKTNPNDADSDDDGLDDGQEVQNNTDPNDADSDNDGLNDGDEAQHGSDPNNPDSDGDGTSDGEEVNAGRDPTINEGAVLMPILQILLD